MFLAVWGHEAWVGRSLLFQIPLFSLLGEQIFADITPGQANFMVSLLFLKFSIGVALNPM